MRLKTARRATLPAVIVALGFLLAGPSRAEHLFVASNSTDSVFLYNVAPTGVPVLETVLSDSLNRPAGLAFDPSGDLLVVNRGTGAGGAGSITRFTDPLGTASLASTIDDIDGDPSFDFDQPHFALFRGAEMFVVNSYMDRVPRYLFDGAGNAIPNGAITSGLCCTDARGIVLSPFTGDLFVTIANRGSSQLKRYSFDGSGNASLQQTFSSPGSNDHGMAFAPWGEMFVSEANSNTVARFTFSGGMPVANGQISGNGLLTPVDVAFSQWDEMFVSNAADPTISRWTFDGLGNATANGQIDLPTPAVGLLFAGDAAAVDAAFFPDHRPERVALRAFPNPGRGGTFQFLIDLAEAGPASLVVYDIAGRRVGTVTGGDLPAGRSRASWNARAPDGQPLPAGAYFARLQAAGAVGTAKVIHRW